MKLHNLVTLMITFKEILDVVICLIIDHLCSPLFNRIFSILNVTLGRKFPYFQDIGLNLKWLQLVICPSRLQYMQDNTV